MTTLSTTPFKVQLLDQRASLLAQLRSLRGGTVGRAEASADHFGQAQDSQAQVNTARDLEFALDAHESAELDQMRRRCNALKRAPMANAWTAVCPSRWHACTRHRRPLAALPARKKPSSPAGATRPARLLS